MRFIVDNQNGELIPSMFGKANIEVKKGEKLILPKTVVLKKLIHIMYLNQLQIESLNQ